MPRAYWLCPLIIATALGQAPPKKTSPMQEAFDQVIAARECDPHVSPELSDKLAWKPRPSPRHYCSAGWKWVLGGQKANFVSSTSSDKSVTFTETSRPETCSMSTEGKWKFESTPEKCWERLVELHDASVKTDSESTMVWSHNVSYDYYILRLANHLGKAWTCKAERRLTVY